MNRKLLSLFLMLTTVPIFTEYGYPQTHPIDGEYITEWLLLGPFFQDDLDTDFLADVGGEANVYPKEGDVVTTAVGDTLTWKRYQTNRSFVDLVNVVGNYQHATAYAFCTLKSDVEGKNQILLGSDDGVAVWINGKRAHYNPAGRPLFLDHDVFEADLKEGTNRCLVKVSQGFIHWGFAMRAFPRDLAVASVTPRKVLWAEGLKIGSFVQYGGCKYHPGDNTEWARPDFDDSDWAQIKHLTFPHENWQGIGWFRYALEVDSTLWHVPLGLFIGNIFGGAEFYLDGKLLHQFGRVVDSKQEEEAYIMWEPRAISFHPPPGHTGRSSQHLVAIRYSSFFWDSPTWSGQRWVFNWNIGNLEKMSINRASEIRIATIYQMLLMGIFLAFALLHLLLFLFYRSHSNRTNLYYAALTAFAALAVYFFCQLIFITNAVSYFWHLRLLHVAWTLMALSTIRLTYFLIYPKLPKIFVAFFIVGFSLNLWFLLRPLIVQRYLSIFYFAAFAEILRVLVMARVKKRELVFEGSWTILLGLIPLSLTQAYGFLLTFDVVPESWDFPAPFYALLILIISMSVFLARNFARTQMENARKTQELEGARKLQLSMLPQKVPSLPNYEIAADMKTATEVGGDYYDFHVAKDGTLTVAVGDATGHGTKAGTMVISIKTLFNTLERHSDIVEFFHECSKIIKSMYLGNLYMGMTLAQFHDHKMVTSAAGMPPILIYRAATKSVEEVVLKGMPLGGHLQFPYQHKEVSLDAGDTILLMTDGLEELFNDKREMLDYPRVKEIFKEAADRSADEIVAHLFKAGERWSNGRPQDDDITFVVLKVKQNGTL